MNDHPSQDRQSQPNPLALSHRDLGLEPVQCSAKSKQTGQQCKNFVKPGFKTCRFHGGGTQAAKDKAKERLEAMVDEAITDLHSLTKQRVHLPTALGAVKAVLDRGIGPVNDSAAKPGSVPQVIIGVQIGSQGSSHSDVQVIDIEPEPESE